MLLLNEPQLDRVQDYMKAFTAHRCPDPQIAQLLDRLYDPSGKMLRASLLILCAGVCEKLSGNEADHERVYRMAALIELTHYCSLIHDDIVDDSPLRRNKPSVQSKYGKNAAVFAGDVLLARVFHHFVSEGIQEISLMMTTLFEQMCMGEICEDMRKFDPLSGMDDYLDVIKKKTALLFRTACTIGCICAQAEEETKELLSTLGEKLGIMFQIRDDLLDYISDKSREGKDTHRDFFEGIYTYPLLAALENSSAREELAPYLEQNARGCLTGADFAAVTAVIRTHGGFRQAEHFISELADECYAILDALEEKLTAAGTRSGEPGLIRRVVKRVQNI